jgi:hypothetical protein
MRKGASKSKGNFHERKIAKMLSNWYYGEPNALIRTPSSGAVATFRLDKEMPCGDIMQVKYYEIPFPFSVESKHYKTADLIELLNGNKSSILIKSWKQAKNECGENKKPLLVFTANYKPTLVFVPVNVYWNGLDIMNSLCWDINNVHEAFVILFNDLLKSDPNKLKKYFESENLSIISGSNSAKKVTMDQ